MKRPTIERDRADDRLDNLAREGLSWDDYITTRRAAAAKAAETRRRRARGEPEPPPPPRRKLTSDAVLWWSATERRVCMRTNRRPSLIDDIRSRVPKAARWFRDYDRAWLFDPGAVGVVYGILREHFERVALDVEVARLLGWLIFEPQGPDGEGERAA